LPFSRKHTTGCCNKPVKNSQKPSSYFYCQFQVSKYFQIGHIC
jgi:hypothetical protein